jgi:arabinoxylan arabinofuranohydrolase
MISYSGDIITFEIKDKAAFGPDYEEAPWVFKRNGIYYMMYAAHIPEAIYYTTSTTPLGPWKYGGVVMKAGAQGCNGNHPGVIQYKGKWYLFYFNQDLPGGHDKKRAVNVIFLEFNPDGSIPELPHSKAGVVQAVKNLNPYIRVEAETIAWEEGVETAKDDKTGVYVTEISNGDYIKVRNVDFEKGANKFEVSTAAIADVGNIEIRIDGLDGTLLGTCEVKKSGNIRNWSVLTCKIKHVIGLHDVYFVFKGGEGDLFNFDWWKFD